MSVFSSDTQHFLSIAEYLAENNVHSTPVHPDTVAAPRVSIQVPQGWREIPREVLPGAYCAWSRVPDGATNWADNVLIMIGRLDQAVDSTTLLRCGHTDSRRMPGWQDIQADTSDCSGFPAAAILGKYRVEDDEFVAYTRYVMIDRGPAQYLIQVTATVRAGSPTAVADISMIMSGLNIAVADDRGAPSGGTQARPHVEPRTIATADVRGIGIGLESSGRLHSLTIDAHAFAKGPDALAASIVDAYQRAAAALPSSEAIRSDTAVPDPSKWRAPTTGGDWLPDNQPSRPADYVSAAEQPYPWQQYPHRPPPHGPAQSQHYPQSPPPREWR
ncbi:LpqN/LpqT family lipoprotein [Nocardia sp. NPDC019395]|uniref:LpqN/LpqT family lipoprotein n=1 Tax=Nocardia sp. NPDC019395 TaxID=3154686 RepID=UPI0033C307A3